MEKQKDMEIKSFWEAVLGQKRDELACYFSSDAVIRWHCTNEQFTVEEFVRVNCDYPGEWEGIIECIEKTEHGYVTAVRVFPTDRSAFFHVVSFFTLENERIIALDEYWADDGEAPNWRQEMDIGVTMR